MKIIQYQELDSTNAEAQRLIKNGSIKETTIVKTNYQTLGRGQQNNIWISESGENLLMSLIFMPQIHVSDQFKMNMKTCLGIIDMLLEIGIKAKIKWPNDIFVDDKKIAGILIENNVSGNIITHTIIGIGLNVNQTVFPDSLKNANSIKNILHKKIPIQIILDTLIEKLKVTLAKNNNPKQEYLKNLYLLNQPHQYLYHSKKITAAITDISPTGELILIKDDDSVIHCSVKELIY
jgi:BirA family biotin operon repressor/biotin-[acetyl-CoA-carboxylase] ligase